MAKRRPGFFINIDLLHPRSEQPKIWVKALSWMLSNGKYFVIVVEIVVVGAFLSRYKFDNDLANIQDKIKEQVPYIQSLHETELTLRTTQFQLATISKTKKESPNWSQLMTKIASLTPQNTKLTNVSFDRTQKLLKTSLTISGQANSNTELAAFVKALQQDQTFMDITLNSLNFDKQNLLFTISGGLK